MNIFDKPVAVKVKAAVLHRQRVLYLRKHGLCICGGKLASKCHCLTCLVRNREAARLRTRAKQRRQCLSRRLERERNTG